MTISTAVQEASQQVVIAMDNFYSSLESLVVQNAIWTARRDLFFAQLQASARDSLARVAIRLTTLQQFVLTGRHPSFEEGIAADNEILAGSSYAPFLWRTARNRLAAHLENVLLGLRLGIGFLAFFLVLWVLRVCANRSRSRQECYVSIGVLLLFSSMQFETEANLRGLNNIFGNVGWVADALFLVSPASSAASADKEQLSRGSPLAARCLATTVGEEAWLSFPSPRPMLLVHQLFESLTLQVPESTISDVLETALRSVESQLSEVIQETLINRYLPSLVQARARLPVHGPRCEFFLQATGALLFGNVRLLLALLEDWIATLETLCICWTVFWAVSLPYILTLSANSHFYSRVIKVLPHTPQQFDSLTVHPQFLEELSKRKGERELVRSLRTQKHICVTIK
jgi:hypothetical protein